MILTYHEITPEPSAYIYSATVPELREHIQLIRSFSQAVCTGSPTFDDGHLSHFTHALPVLEAERQKGIFFVTVGWTDIRDGFMTWAHLRELAGLGHSVQAHGLTHTLLTHCDRNQLTEELRAAKQRLEDGLGLPVSSLSLPGGRCNRQVLATCAEEGYHAVYTSHPYTSPKEVYGMRVMGRAMIRRATSSSALLAIFRSEHEWWSRERILFQLKHGIRSTLGDSIYHRLWHWAGNSRLSLAARSSRGYNAE